MIDDVRTSLEAAFYFVGILAAGVSAWSYRKNSRRERTRWLFDLYQRYYERPDLKAIWRRVDEGDTSFLEQGEDAELRSHFDDLLNFFEFIAILWKRREIRREEIADMFSYPLAKLALDVRAREYVRTYDYEHLEGLFIGLGYTSLRDRS